MKTPVLMTYGRNLPHWRMDGSTYFVTWRLAAPQAPLNYAERTIVADAIKHFCAERYNLLAYVVMDDHVHVLAKPAEGFSLREIVHTWKSFTANRLQLNFGRIGRIWQKGHFDRIVRNERELETKANYILGNPARSWPELQEYKWAGYGSSLSESGPAGTPAPTVK